MALDKNKEDMIARIVSAMEAEGRFIQQNDNYSTDNKLSRMDVILDVVHFLGDYENNVRILTEHALEHKFDKFSKTEDKEKGER